VMGLAVSGEEKGGEGKGGERRGKEGKEGFKSWEAVGLG